MKHYLMRAGISPEEKLSVPEICARKMLGGNNGNLLYAYSVYRWLKTDDTVIDVDYYNPERGLYTAKDIEYINSHYDAYILPLADAFRQDRRLDRLAAFVGQLKIKTVIIGVGMRAPLDYDGVSALPYEDSVKRLVSAVLDRSGAVGVRGEDTKAMLVRIGFPADRIFVTGCPSLYMFAARAKQKEVSADRQNKVILSDTLSAQQSTHDFIRGMSLMFENSFFLPQEMKELQMMYWGTPYFKDRTVNYPSDLNDPLYVSDRVRYYVSVPEWLSFVSDAAFSIGPRFHGNVAPLVTGVPSVVIVKDTRMKELSQYHGIAHLTEAELAECRTIEEVIEKCDLSVFPKKQQENLERYLSFLKYNELEHIYQNGTGEAGLPSSDCTGEENRFKLYSRCSPYEKAKRQEEKLEGYYSLGSYLLSRKTKQ